MMAQAIGRAVGRSVKVIPTPTWLFMKSARMAGLPINTLSNVRFYIEDHKQGAFEMGAPTTDVLDVTGRPAEDFETIARRYAAQPHNQRTLNNWIREFSQSMMGPFTPSVNFERYDRELRRPVPSAPRFSAESAVWRDEHYISDATNTRAAGRNKTVPTVNPLPQSEIFSGGSR